jgi:hypothetical protein
MILHFEAYRYGSFVITKPKSAKKGESFESCPLTLVPPMLHRDLVELCIFGGDEEARWARIET